MRHRKPLNQKWLTGQPVNQLTNSEKVDESRFHSRVGRRLKGVRFPVQDLEKWELWCKIQRVDFQDFATAACQKAYAEMTGEMPVVVNQLTTINDLDDLDDPRSDDDVSSSSNLLRDSGQLVNQTEKRAREIFAFYTARTGRKVRQSDREAYFKGNKTLPGVSELPDHVIKFGIMQSVLLCKGVVNSFSYCLGAIIEAHEAGITSESVEHLQRTFSVRMELRSNPEMEQDEFLNKLRRAAAGQQPNLPGAGADLKEIGSERAKREEKK
jgi:hypothetical protein